MNKYWQQFEKKEIDSMHCMEVIREDDDEIEHLECETNLYTYQCFMCSDLGCNRCL
jgi:hypothetical protein